MLKVVVFDSGYGGELFADRLEEAVPVIEVIRIINWRNASTMLKSARRARKIAEATLQPYIGRVDLIIFANYLLAGTSLQYFKHKYQNQKFLGLELTLPDTFVDRGMLILTTKAVARSHFFRKFVASLKRSTKTLAIDSWPIKIDDGELRGEEIKYVVQNALKKEHCMPKEVILACAHFYDIKPQLREALGGGLRIYDNFDVTIRNVCKALNLRGGIGKK